MGTEKIISLPIRQQAKKVVKSNETIALKNEFFKQYLNEYFP